MITTEKRIAIVTFQSEIVDEIKTTEPLLAHYIEWADKNPIVYKIVNETRSAPYGKNSSEYIGWARGGGPGAMIERIKWFKAELEKGASFYQWRAQFTFDHYKDKNLRGGYFQQWDGKHPRGCAQVDYTPDTLQTVVDKFRDWCEHSPCGFHTEAIWLNEKPVWTGCEHPSRKRKLTGELVCIECGYTIEVT